VDRPHGQDAGWFSSLELDIVGSHINNNISNYVSASGGAPDLIQLPTGNLDWTGSPRFELGYRMADGWGQFSIAYRLLDTVGHATLPGFDLDGSDGYLKSHLDTNVLDFDYGSREFHPAPQTDLQWRLGLRVATVHFDSDAEGYYLEQEFSNNFWGVGPHAAIDINHQFGNSSLGVFARLEGSVLFGEVHQSFEELFVAADGSYLGGATDVHSSQATPMLDFEIGLSWTPRWRWSNWRWTFGYVFEQWWNVGTAGGSSADLTTQGVFFRGEFSF
jgi:hypothetical protein